MKELIFNKKDYKSYKNMYEDLAIKLERINGLEDYYNIKNYDYDANCLYEDIMYGIDKSLNFKFTFVNFNKQELNNPKNYDDYEYGIIIKIFEEFVKKYPNNSLEFKNE